MARMSAWRPALFSLALTGRGLFVRGDDCLFLAQSIRRVLAILSSSQASEIATFAGRLHGIAQVIEVEVLIDANQR
jgi:hypothetical protein